MSRRSSYQDLSRSVYLGLSRSTITGSTVLTAANIRAADANRAGENAELDAIFAVVVGGTALTGGRFSILGMVSVAVLIVSGAVNTWILVGSVHALLVTDYGRLLLLKIAAFVVMIGFAAVNRLSLTPRLADGAKSGGEPGALAALKRNTRIEIALGLAIFAIVGVLGTLHPAIHLVE